jgi:hypothetical protein
MPLTPKERRLEDIQHLRWRAGFCQTLFEMHRHLPQRDSAWYTKETALLESSGSKDELRRAESAAGVLRVPNEAC